MSEIRHNWITAYFEDRPQIEPPQHGTFGYEIPYAWRGVVKKLFAENRDYKARLETIHNHLTTGRDPNIAVLRDLSVPIRSAQTRLDSSDEKRQAGVPCSACYRKFTTEGDGVLPYHRDRYDVNAACPGSYKFPNGSAFDPDDPAPERQRYCDHMFSLGVFKCPKCGFNSDPDDAEHDRVGNSADSAENSTCNLRADRGLDRE